MATPNAFLFLFMMILMIAAVIYGQIKLSASTNKYYGLIFPLITLIFSIVTILGQVYYDSGNPVQMGLQTLIQFFVWNIPTLVLLAIYYHQREQLNIKNELEKMRKHDL